MNILLVGGGNQFMNAVINKLNKEGHRTYILTGSKNRDTSYKTHMRNTVFLTTVIV